MTLLHFEARLHIINLPDQLLCCIEFVELLFHCTSILCCYFFHILVIQVYWALAEIRLLHEQVVGVVRIDVPSFS